MMEDRKQRTDGRVNGRLEKIGRAFFAATIVYVCLTLAFSLIAGCSRPPARQYFLLNYTPPKMHNRTMQNPYAAVIRLRDFSIEEAYNRPHIVYRTSPFELRYYNFKSWAVRPARMVTDLFFKHLNSAELVSGVVRRFDEGRRPDYEITGFIEALEEFDGEDVLFARLALRINMSRLSDGATIYSRHFDLHKKVYRKETVFVVRELSQIIEYIFTEIIADIDRKLAIEFGITPEVASPAFMQIEQPSFITDDIIPVEQPNFTTDGIISEDNTVTLEE
ncbi:MAG: PqiC family protein [Chitinispirillales bacterium]|jgi:ABC-type uncharacterized transport system auxiliary subunit|nr:PqiC family protein [Chitinispirillales bacterium]